jgi:hypothetical protein
MSRWKLFGKSKPKEEKIQEPSEKVEEISKPDEKVEEISKPDEKVEEISEPCEKVEEVSEPDEKVVEEVTVEKKQPLTEYKETLYTGGSTSNKEIKQTSSDQRIWRDINSIEKNIDNLHLKEEKKPITELEKKVDMILSKSNFAGDQPSRTSSNIIYVISSPQPGQVKGDWAVQENGKISSHHRKKESAIKQARKIAKEKNATVMIQNTDGTFSEGFKPR